MRKSLFTILLITAAGFPFVQAGAQQKMTLRECMEYAVSNSTKMRIAEADRNDEQTIRRQAIMQAFTPTISAASQLYEKYGRNIDPETNIYTTTSSLNNNYGADASIALFNGFSAINNIKIADTSVKMGASKDEQTRNEICLATMEAFYNVIYYSSLEKVLIEQVETAQQALRRMEKQEQLGQKSHADVVQLQSELAQKQYQLTNASNQHKDALITLKDVMFWPVEDELELDENVSEPLPEAVCADDVADFAKEHQPSANIAWLNLRTAGLELRNARAAYSPSLYLYGGVSSGYLTYPKDPTYIAKPYFDQMKSRAGGYLQMSLNIPIFDKYSRQSRINQKKSAYTRAEAQYDQKMRDIENEVYRAVNDRDGAEAAYRQAQRLADVQQEAFNLNSKRFEQGLISSIEYHTASESYLNACAESLGSLLKYCLKESVVKFYNGTPYIEQF